MAREIRPKDYPKLKNYQPTRFMLPTSHYDNPQVNAGQMAMAGGGSVTNADMSSFVSAIKDAVSSVNGGSGDIVIPVYLGGTILDEVIVNAQQRANLRSGGR